MKIWLIKRMEDIGYDEYDAKVVLAWTEESARRVAALRTADEGSSCWLDPGRSVVYEVLTDGEHEEVVLDSFRAG